MGDYLERLRVPLAWWLLAMPSAVILGATLYAGLTGPCPVIIMAGLVGGCAARGAAGHHGPGYGGDPRRDAADRGCRASPGGRQRGRLPRREADHPAAR